MDAGSRARPENRVPQGERRKASPPGFAFVLSDGPAGRGSGDACPGFIQVSDSPGRLELTLWGVLDRSSAACPTAIAILEETFVKEPPHKEPVLTFVLNQPDGTSVEFQITVVGSGLSEERA